MLLPTSLILVCLLPTPRDLEIARLLGWYRIPFKSAPKVVAVDYLGFYLNSSFGEQGAGAIRGGGQGHELTTRLELLRDEPDQPRAHEEYYKIQIGGLEKLPHPLEAEKWRRITFLSTTGEYLLKAKTLNDLVVNSEERQFLWRSLRERAVSGQQYHANLPELDVDTQVLIDLSGIKEISSEYDSHTSLNNNY